MEKVTIIDSAFTPFVNSASLRGDNVDVSPRHVEWTHEHGYNAPVYTDGEIKNAQGLNSIAWLLEPSHLRPENYQTAYDMRDKFDAILTYDKKLLRMTSKARFYPLGGSSIAFDDWKIYPKTKRICMILSDKKTTQGHKLRHEVAMLLGDEIDCYGNGANKPFNRKLDILKDYQYCVVIESGKSDYYFSEKLIDCLSVGTIPIYWGCPSIGSFFDLRGMYRFDTIDELNKILNSIKALSAKFIYRNFKTAKTYRICEDRPEFLEIVRTKND